MRIFALFVHFCAFCAFLRIFCTGCLVVLAGEHRRVKGMGKIWQDILAPGRKVIGGGGRDAMRKDDEGRKENNNTGEMN